MLALPLLYHHHFTIAFHFYLLLFIPAMDLIFLKNQNLKLSYTTNTETVVWKKRSVEKALLETSQNSQKNTYEFCEISKNTFFQRTHLVAASEISIAKFYVVSKTSFSVRTFMYRNLKTFSVRYFIDLVFPPALVKSSKVISCKEGGR